MFYVKMQKMSYFCKSFQPTFPISTLQGVP